MSVYVEQGQDLTGIVLTPIPGATGRFHGQGPPTSYSWYRNWCPGDTYVDDLTGDDYGLYWCMQCCRLFTCKIGSHCHETLPQPWSAVFCRCYVHDVLLAEAYGVVALLALPSAGNTVSAIDPRDAPHAASHPASQARP